MPCRCDEPARAGAVGRGPEHAARPPGEAVHEGSRQRTTSAPDLTRRRQLSWWAQFSPRGDDGKLNPAVRRVDTGPRAQSSVPGGEKAQGL